MKKTYIITKDVKVPFVVNSGQAHKPAQIRYKVFRKGKMVKGELKHSNNKPAFVLVGTMGVLPLNCVQEVTSTPIVSNFDDNSDEIEIKKETKQEPKVQYGDALIIGALLGLLAVYGAQKYNYLDAEEKKYKLYGAVVGGVLGLYYVYRKKNVVKNVKIVKSK